MPIYLNQKLQGANENTKSLLMNTQKSGKIYVVGAEIAGRAMIRFAVCSRFTNATDIHYAWNEICAQTDRVLGQKRTMNHEIMNGQK